MEAARLWAEDAWHARVGALEAIAAGESVSETWTELANGMVQRTHSRPTAKERMQAVAMLGRYARIPEGAAPSPGAGTLQPQDLPTLVRALGVALADPGVRAWLERSHPDVVSLLRAAAATDVTSDSDSDTMQVVATQGDTQHDGV